VLSGRGLCDELITRPEKSYRLYCVVVCDLETSRTGAPYIYDISSLRVKKKDSKYVSIVCIRNTIMFYAEAYPSAEVGGGGDCRYSGRSFSPQNKLGHYGRI